MTTPRTASNSEARKRLAEQDGNHVPHWDPAVVQLIEQARAEGAAEALTAAAAEIATWVVVGNDLLDAELGRNIGYEDAALELDHRAAALRGLR